ncbi:MAG: flagellar hook-associated protein FlgL [Burkholderiales bacterium]|nr:flagellar hook-associated protein FlgL [Burkholderiales bacterium]
MRISTSTIFDTGVYGMQQQTTTINHTQQQLSSGSRILTPADDPIAAARALEVGQADSINTQYGVNQNSATSRLSLNESILGSVTTLIQNVQSQAVNSGNATLSNSDRATLAAQVSGVYQQLLGLANSTDGNGVYLFSGAMGTTQPFQNTVSGVQYNGDQGSQTVQIGTSRQIQVSLSGADVFQNIKTGNGSFVTQAAISNGGSAMINAGVVTNQANWSASSKNFTIQFSVSGSASTYNVIDNSTNTTVLSAQPYTSGSAISLGTSGASVTINGIPANGDAFTVKPSANESVFTTINNLITALQTPINNTAGNAALTNSLNTASQNLSNDLNNILTIRAANGARINEVTTAKSTSGNLGLQYKSTLSQLQDVDYTQAISQLNQATVALQAAQKSFVQTSNLSLFTYMP